MASPGIKPTDNPVATSTTSIIVPQQPPQQQHLYDGWGVANLIWVGIVALMSALTIVIGVVKGVGELWDKFISRSKARLAPLESRIQAVEDSTKRFRAVDELDRDKSNLAESIQHIKRNLQGQIDLIAERMRSSENNYNDMRLAYTKLEGKVEGMIEQQNRQGKALDRLEEKTDEGFKSLTSLILNRNDHHG